MCCHNYNYFRSLSFSSFKATQGYDDSRKLIDKNMYSLEERLPSAH